MVTGYFTCNLISTDCSVKRRISSAKLFVVLPFLLFPLPLSGQAKLSSGLLYTTYMAAAQNELVSPRCIDLYELMFGYHS